MHSDFGALCPGSRVRVSAFFRPGAAQGPRSTFAALGGAMAGFSTGSRDSMCLLDKVTAQSAAEAPADCGGPLSENSPASSGRPSLGASSSTASFLPSPPSSAKRSMTFEEEMWCPDKVRRVAQTTLNKPLRIVVERIPRRADVDAESFLLYYAGALVQRAGLTSARRRVTAKQPPCASELLVAYAAADFSAVDHLTWPRSRDRLNAFVVVAKILSCEYNVDSLKGRSIAKGVWATCDILWKNRWAILVASQGFGELQQKHRCSGSENDAPAREVSGCLFTWQTFIGRSVDSVKELLDAGIHGERLVELMSEDASVQKAFDEFHVWIQTQAESHGFRYFATSMEVSTRGAQAVAHLHAYVCVDWCQDINMQRRRKPIVEPSLWKYESYMPHCAPSRIVHSKAFTKVLQSGLFYVCADKIGSVFRRCNAEPFEAASGEIRFAVLGHASHSAC